MHQISIKYIVKLCNKNNNLMFNPSVENTSLFLVGISDLSSRVMRYPYAKTTHVFSTDRLNTCLFSL